MSRALILLFILALSSCESRSQQSFSDFTPSRTFVFISGVLEWENGLSGFEKKNRKDEELFNLFKKLGVPESNLVLLLDAKASKKEMLAQLEALCKKAGEGSTLIFYYAGHGLKSEKGKTCFANYDINPEKPVETGLDVSEIRSVIAGNFRGSTVWLTADCCYSGALIAEGEKITEKKVLVSTSATSSNASTGNWTFSQTMIDCLSGLALADRNNDGNITAGEWSAELADAMKYREQQKSGFKLYGITDSYVIAKAKGRHPSTGDTEYPAGCYVLVETGKEKETARITGKAGYDYSCEFYHYSDKSVKTFAKDKLLPFQYVQYPAGKELEVDWNGKYYKAKVLKTDGDFHYITYPGYENYWDEWVMSDRIKSGETKTIEVEWNGQWYPSTILEEKDGKYFIHYTGYGDNYNEWVGKERIRGK